MDGGDEIEFFGFVPEVFSAELRENIWDVLADGIDQLSALNSSESYKVSKILLESFKRNYFIFLNFILNNVFRFPETFRPERKVCDVIVTISMQTVTDELLAVFEEERHYKTEMLKLQNEIEVEIYRRNSYLSLLKCSECVNDLAIRIERVQEELEAVGELHNKLTMSGNAFRDKDLDTLLEYKEMKNDLSMKEMDNLISIGTGKVLATLNEALEQADGFNEH